MATGRRLGQGGSLGLVTVSLLLANACSGDSSVDFDPITSTHGGSDSSGGGDSDHAGNAAKAGATSSGGGAQAGSGHAGNQTAAGTGGTDGQETGGTDSEAKGGNPSGGKAGSGGSANGGKGGTDSGGGKSGNGGTDAGGGKGGTDAGGSAGGGKGGTNTGGSAGGGKGGSAGGGAGGAAGGGAGGKGGAGGSGGADAGGCTSGTFGSSAYYFCGIVDSAALAAEKCESLGMALITIQSPEENAYVAGKLKSSAWLGGSDAFKEGDWYWLDQTLFTKNAKPLDGVYSSWAEGQPNNNGASGASENCVALVPAGVSATSAKWNDLACDLTGMRAACEGPLN